MSSSSRQLPLSALRAFEAAARCMSFVSAAQELGVTPSAVSYQVKRLEDRIGRQLFIRRNRGLLLSPTGARLAAPLTEQFARLAALVAQVSIRSTNSLEVTAMPSLAAKWLAPRLNQFALKQPKCRVRVVGNDELVNFNRSTFDVGVRYGSGQYPGLYVDKLMEVTAFPVCSREFLNRHRKHIRAARDLLLLPLLHDEACLIAPRLPSWPLWFEAARVDYTPRIAGLSFDSAHMAVEAALAGQGIALGLRPLVSADIQAGRLVRLFDLELNSPYSVWFVCSLNRVWDPKITAFREWLHTESIHS